MAGGLINIVSYGAQDLYLTGTPQITHFKLIYRRYTNFSMESIEIRSEDPIDFGKKTRIKLPTVGDLVHKMYLKLSLPRIEFIRSVDNNKVNEKLKIYEDSLLDLENISNFLALNKEAFRKAYNEYLIENSTLDDIKKIITDEFNIASYIDKYRKRINADLVDNLFKYYNKNTNMYLVDLFKYEVGNNFDIKNITLDDIAKNFNNTTLLEIKKIINDINNLMKDLMMPNIVNIYNLIIKYKKIQQDNIDIILESNITQVESVKKSSIINLLNIDENTNYISDIDEYMNIIRTTNEKINEDMIKLKQIIKNEIFYNSESYNDVKKYYNNNIDILNLINELYNIYIKSDSILIYSEYTNLVEDIYNQNINVKLKSNFNYLISSYEKNIKAELITKLENTISLQRNMYQIFELMSRDKYNDYLNEKNPYYNFAWVKKLGHSIIDYIDVYIGGEKIDRHYGDWIDIWYELTGNIRHSDNYNKMIGNIEQLTKFERNFKDNYILCIPLQFWFCKYNGCSIPLVAMQYNDIYIDIKLKKFSDVAYIEKDALYKNNEMLLTLDDLYNDYTKRYSRYLDGSLLVDYIYLDSPERRKFAQSAHEYLIEQVQLVNVDNVDIENNIIRLDFNHLSKELIWIAQKNSFIDNSNGYTETMWYNYGINHDGTNNIIDSTKIELNGHTLIESFDGSFFNYLQPYYKHKKTPSDGINVYSFSIMPEEIQPSGSCNFTRLSDAKMTIKLKSNAFNINGSNKTDTINIKIYSLSYNVLRIISGYGGLAFA